MSTLTVQVTPEHMRQLRRTPVTGMLELIKNALDADATRVDVTFKLDDIGGTGSLEILDNGTGMTLEDVRRYFPPLGRSWKRTLAHATDSGRPFFGRRGRGRFTAFAIGEQLRWESWAVPAGAPITSSATVLASSPAEPAASGVSEAAPADGAPACERVVVDWHVDTDTFTAETEPAPRGMPADLVARLAHSQPPRLDVRRTGSRVIVTGVGVRGEQVRSVKAMTTITEGLAEYLWLHPAVTVSVDGQVIDWVEVALDTHELDLDMSDVVALLREAHASGLLAHLPSDLSGRARLVITEWQHNVHASVSVCRPDETFVAAVPVRVPAAGIAYSAKVVWNGADAVEQVQLAGDLSAAAAGFNTVVRTRLRDFFAERADSARAMLLATWREEGSYPYTGEPADAAEESERELFDIVAVTAAPALGGSDTPARTFAFQLLRQALRTDADALHRVLEQVLGLNEEDLADLDDLLTKSSLPAMIAIAKTTTDRIAFCAWLTTVLNDTDWVRTLTERAGLQDIIERNAWIFGDDWQTVIADRGLAAGLDRLREQGLPDIGAAETVRDTEGRIVRVDLLLSRAREAFGRRQHLVVELKRPSQTLRKTELDQLDNYVTTVVGDAQFNDGSIDWTFLLVGRDCDDYVDRKRTSPDRPSGVVDVQRLPNGATYTVIVRPWSEILGEAESRLRFLSQHLPDFPDDAEIARLSKAHADLGMGPGSNADAS